MNTEGTGPVPNPSLGLDNPATWSTILGDKQRFVHVTCNAVPGVYLLDDQAVVCGCAACTAAGKPSGEHLISPTEFERHAGLGATRKWRHSIKVTAGQPGRCEGAAVISIGRWLDEQNAANPGNSAAANAVPKSGGWRAQQRERQQQQQQQHGSVGTSSGPHLPSPRAQQSQHAAPAPGPSTTSNHHHSEPQASHVWAGSMRKIPSGGNMSSSGAPMVKHTTMIIHNKSASHSHSHHHKHHPAATAPAATAPRHAHTPRHMLAVAPTPVANPPAVQQQLHPWQMPPPAATHHRHHASTVHKPVAQLPERGSGPHVMQTSGFYTEQQLPTGGRRRSSAGDLVSSRGASGSGSASGNLDGPQAALYAPQAGGAGEQRAAGNHADEGAGFMRSNGGHDGADQRPGLAMKLEADGGAGGGGVGPHANTGHGDGLLGPSRPAETHTLPWFAQPMGGKGFWDVQPPLAMGPQGHRGAAPFAAGEAQQGVGGTHEEEHEGSDMRPAKRFRAAVVGAQPSGGARRHREVLVTSWHLSSSDSIAQELHISVAVNGRVFTGVLTPAPAGAAPDEPQMVQAETTAGVGTGRGDPGGPPPQAPPAVAPHAGSHNQLRAPGLPASAGAVAAAAAAAATAAAMLQRSRSRAAREGVQQLPLWATLAAAAEAARREAVAHRSGSGSPADPQHSHNPEGPSSSSGQQQVGQLQEERPQLGPPSPQGEPGNAGAAGAAAGPVPATGGGKRPSAMVERAAEQQGVQQLDPAAQKEDVSDTGSESSWGPGSEGSDEERENGNGRARVRGRGVRRVSEEEQQGADIMLSLLEQGGQLAGGGHGRAGEVGTGQVATAGDAAVAWQHAAWSGALPQQEAAPAMLMPVLPSAYDPWLLHHFQQQQQQQMLGMHAGVLQPQVSTAGHSSAFSQQHPQATPGLQQPPLPTAIMPGTHAMHQGAHAAPGTTHETQGWNGAGAHRPGTAARHHNGSTHANQPSPSGRNRPARPNARQRTAHRAFRTNQQGGRPGCGSDGDVDEGIEGGSEDEQHQEQQQSSDSEAAARKRQRKRRQQQQLASQQAAAATATIAAAAAAGPARQGSGVQVPTRPGLHNPHAPPSNEAAANAWAAQVLSKSLLEEGEEEAALLGGTTGQGGRVGRCAVCVIQRKGKCGTDSAPRKCLRRQLLEAMEEGGGEERTQARGE